MIEYATKHETPRLEESYSDHARSFAKLVMAKKPEQRPTPGMLLRLGNLGASHPFFASHAGAGTQVVAEWIAQGVRGMGPLLSVAT